MLPVIAPLTAGYIATRTFMGPTGTNLLLTGSTGLAKSSAGRNAGFDAFSPKQWSLAAFILLPMVPVGMVAYDISIRVSCSSGSAAVQTERADKSIPRVPTTDARGELGRGAVAPLSLEVTVSCAHFSWKRIPGYLLPWLPLAIYGHLSDTPRGRLLRVDAFFPPGPVTTLAIVQVLGGVLREWRVSSAGNEDADGLCRVPAQVRSALNQALFGGRALPAFTTYAAKGPALGLAVAGWLEATLASIDGWLHGMALAYLGERWLPLGRLLGQGSPHTQAWRVDPVRPDWWACAVGGCASALLVELCRIG